MTHTNQQERTVPDAVTVSSRNTSMSPSQALRPNTDSLSDNDNGEKPVREKLKKTSLASMSNHVVERQERTLKSNREKYESVHVKRDSSPGKDVDKKAGEPRGRPVKKRSFDDLDTPDSESVEAGIEPVAKPYANGHLRKRSRDVRVGELSIENRRPLLAGTPVREESEDSENGFDTNEACTNGSKNVADRKSPAIEVRTQVETEQSQQFQDSSELTRSLSGTVHCDRVIEMEKDSADQEMREPASTPQKKRSRDQIDTDADREQKIPATEEARAHRRSDELERSEISAVRNRSPVSPKGSSAVGKQPITVEEEKGLVSHIGVKRQEVSLTVRP